MADDAHIQAIDALLKQSVLILREHLGADDAPVSVLIDPTLVNTVCDAFAIRSALAQGTLQRLVVPIAHDDIAPDASPYLLHAPSERSAERALEHTLWVALVEALADASPLTAPRQVCAWIIGEADPRTLARRLSQVALIRMPDGTPRPLRYWDPRVMWHLPQTLAPSRWAALKTAMGSWLTLDMRHQLGPVSAAASTHGVRSDKGHAGRSTRCTQAEWSALARIGAINTALAQAHAWGVPPSTEAASQIDSLLRACEVLGFDTRQDGQVFVACGLTSHLRFYEHPCVHDALSAASAAGQSVMSALERFNDAFWDELSQHSLNPSPHSS